jgi:hypothetical protein
MGMDSRDIEKKPHPTIHPLSALLLMVIDGLWSFVEWTAVTWLVTIPLSFLAVFLPILLIQKAFNGDSPKKAVAIASFLGVLAAVPTPVTGTVAGLAVLTLAGIRSFGHKRERDQ